MRDSDFRQLNIIYIEGNRAWSYCCYHKDIDRPNLCISLVDKYYGKCICWACGKGAYLNKQQMSELNLSTFTIHKNSEDKLRTRWKEFTESCYNNLQKFPLLKIGLAKQLNISIESLDDWLVGYDNFSFTIPMFREDLSDYYWQKGLCGIQRRYPDGTKRCITGSRLGLMYSFEKVADDLDCMFICEGFSDGISLYDLGLNSIARPHCHHIDGIEEFLSDTLEGTESIGSVIIVPDNDTVGREGAAKLQDILENSYDCKIFSFDGEAKDIRKYIAKVGRQQVREELEKYII